MKLTFRIWVLIIVLIISLLMLAPWKALDKGVLIKSVDKNSTLFNDGLRAGMTITALNGDVVNNLEDYSSLMSQIFSVNSTKIKLEIQTTTNDFIVLTDKIPDITVASLPKSNVKTGLDLSGGSRAMIQAKDHKLSSAELQDLIDVITNRLNVYGIADMNILPVSDLSGNNYMLIEIAGATPADLEQLISQQGKFEAKIGNQTVFIGGNRDIADVCRKDATCAYVESCPKAEQGYYCNFRFSVFLSEEAAQRHADITSEIPVNSSLQGNYLSEKLDLYVDDSLLSSLLISEGLKGRVTTQISISGSGSGATQAEAYESAEDEMHNLQTILITGSLPYKLEIVKLDTISPLFGKKFMNTIVMLAASVFIIISLILFGVYRNIKSSLAVILTMFSEAFITLAIASFINWNLDAASIAGIIAGMGTGVNDQIVILSEASTNKSLSLKERIKSALFVIFGAFFTIIAAMIPLFWAGAGMLKGLALTTIITVTAGILITRPAFADIIRKIGE